MQYILAWKDIFQLVLFELASKHTGMQAALYAADQGSKPAVTVQIDLYCIHVVQIWKQ